MQLMVSEFFNFTIIEAPGNTQIFSSAFITPPQFYDGDLQTVLG